MKANVEIKNVIRKWFTDVCLINATLVQAPNVVCKIKNIRAMIYLYVKTRSTSTEYKKTSTFFLFTATLLVAHLAFSFWTKLKMSFSSFCCHFNFISYWFGKDFFHFHFWFLAEDVETAKNDR